ncbi:hypothetical protein C8Q80DRAFT_1264242 [Daedaleopsis nitida]|nr:hypothetical protein C8Q80DRAFT_1264242 [Daedaleopsis nitida]
MERHDQLGPIFTSDITAIALGTQHTVYLSAPSQKVADLGSARRNQLSGLGTLGDIEQFVCTWNGTCALLHGGDVAATGSNTHSQLRHSLQTGADAP